MVNKKRNNDEENKPIRVRTPRKNESIGVLEQRLGASRVKVRCFDGNTRVCRVPGRLKRSLWLREGNIVLVEPWEFGGDDKGDVIFKYRKNQISWLKAKGYLKKLDDFDSF